MTGFAVFFLFGVALAASSWTLFTSLRVQLCRFRELSASYGSVAAPAPTPRLTRIRARTFPARMLRAHQLPAAA